MATFREFANFIGTQFPVLDNGDGSLRIDTAWNDGRSHWVHAEEINALVPAVILLAPICSQREASAASVIAAIDRGGFSLGMRTAGDDYVLVHIMALDGLGEEEAARGVELILAQADELERALTGSDSFRANIAPGSGGPAAGGFCTGCGTARVPGASFCGSCGTRIE